MNTVFQTSILIQSTCLSQTCPLKANPLGWGRGPSSESCPLPLPCPNLLHASSLSRLWSNFLCQSVHIRWWIQWLREWQWVHGWRVSHRVWVCHNRGPCSRPWPERSRLFCRPALPLPALGGSRLHRPGTAETVQIILGFQSDETAF